MIKVACPNHPEFSVRMTRTWIEAETFGAPLCPNCHATMIAAGTTNRKAA